MIAYIGGKNRMSKWISSYVPNNIKTYVEPFSGAFWVYINSDIYKIKSLENVVYNDINQHMANLFLCCKDYKNFYEYIKDIKAQNSDIFHSFKISLLNNHVEGFKSNNPNFLWGLEYAYVFTQVFSGTGIKHSTKMIDLKGKYTSKFDAFRNRLIKKNIQEKFDKISNIDNNSYKECIEKYDGKDTLFYLDPPYYGTEDYYSFHDFTKDDHEKLSNILKDIKGRFMLSYYDFPLLSELYPKDKYRWESKEFNKIASTNTKKSVGTEILILNY